MGSKTDVRRRWWGAIFLATALLMLIAGETILAGRLSPFDFAVFWSVCMLCTFGAIIVALRDLAATRRRTRDEQRALFAKTLNDIARSSEARAQHLGDHKQ